MGLPRGDRAHGWLSIGSTGAGGRHGTGGNTAHTSLGRRRSRELAQSPMECGHGRESRVPSKEGQVIVLFSLRMVC